MGAMASQLVNRLFRRRSKKISNLCVTGLCAGNSPVTGEFPAQMASNVENVSIWWRHHGTCRSHWRVTNMQLDHLSVASSWQVNSGGSYIIRHGRKLEASHSWFFFSLENFCRVTEKWHESFTMYFRVIWKWLTTHSQVTCEWLATAVGNILAPTLSVIINQSLYTGIFPDKLKVAKVLPLLKKGDNWLMENYRPISLLSTLSKVFERVVFEQMYEYLNSNNLLYQSQYGFRKDHSTELASTELIDRICKVMDKGETPFSIFLDLSKAFDMLDHDILLTKLRHYGIVGTPLIWFKSYLTNRAQYVEINGTCSNLLSIGKGVPQGSFLGPLLFIIFINDIHRSSKEFKFITYADDTTLFSSLSSFIPDSNRSMANASETINSEINKVTDWLIVNKLSLNVNKTKFMVFHYYQRIRRYWYTKFDDKRE